MWVGRAAIHSAWAAGDSPHCWTRCSGAGALLPGPAAVLRSLGTLAGTPFFWQSALLSLERIFAGFPGRGGPGGCSGGVLRSLPLGGRAYLTRCGGHPRHPVALLYHSAPPVGCHEPGPRRLLRPDGPPGGWGNVRKGVGETDPSCWRPPGPTVLRPGRRSGWSMSPQFCPTSPAAAPPPGPGLEGGIAAEVLCLPKTAIGTQIFNSKRYLETPDLFA